MAIKYTLLTPIKLAPSLLLTLIFLPFSSLALPLEYSASYEIKKYGIIIAKSHYTLKHENNGLRMTQHTELAGLASLVRKDIVDENSFISLQNNQLLLTEFSYRQRPNDKKNRDIQLKIDWQQSEKKLLGKVSGTANGKKLELTVDKPVWDTSSYQIPLMLSISENKKQQQYSIMSKGHFKSYSYITRGTEKIDVNGHNIQTIKIERAGKSNNRPMYLWLAPSLNNLPVKIEKWKDGKINLKMSLIQVQFPADKSMKFEAVASNDSDFEL